MIHSLDLSTAQFGDESAPISWMNSLNLVVDEFYWSDQRLAIQVDMVEGGFSSGSSATCVAKCLLGRRCPLKTEGQEQGIHLCHYLGQA